MQRFLSFALVVAILVAGGYWYQYVYSRCPAPLLYRIGTIDPQFNLSEEEARAALSDAESLWEDASGQNLFTYDPKGKLVVNFVFDERQALTDEEHTLREILDKKENINSDVREQYEQLLEKYEQLRTQYTARVAKYQNELAVHNGEVAYWNNRGGAPKDVYTRLNTEQRRLDAEGRELNTLADSLNELVDQINNLGNKSNQTTRDYNTTVQDYNSRFTQEREFTQGDYYRSTISIYQFDTALELRLVLAHELGHALSLEHVDDSQAVMYHLMEGQHTTLALTDADIAELSEVCGAP